MIFVDPDGKEIHISYEVRDEYGERPKLRTVVVNEDGSLSNSDGSAYEGDNEFVKETAAAINELKDMEGEVGEVINHLLKKDNAEDGDKRVGVHTIVENDRVKNGPDDGSHNVKGRSGPNGSTSQFRPDVDRSNGNSELENATDEQILGHELKHEYNKSTRKGLSTEKSDTHTSKEETDATNFENKIIKIQNKEKAKRGEKKNPLRTTHGGKKLINEKK